MFLYCNCHSHAFKSPSEIFTTSCSPDSFFLSSFGSVVGQGTYFNVRPSQNVTRTIAFASFLMTCFIFGVMYKSVLMSKLMAPTLTRPIDSLDDLRSMPHIKVITESNVFVEQKTEESQKDQKYIPNEVQVSPMRDTMKHAAKVAEQLSKGNQY